MTEVMAIWAEDCHGVIGQEGHLPWHIPYDLKFFKEKTWHKAVIMGRKTFEGMHCQPLPHRENIVLTSNRTYHCDGIQVMHSMSEVIQFIHNAHQDIAVIGGPAIFEDLFPYCDVIYRTIVEGSYTGDTYAPTLPQSLFHRTAITYVPRGENNHVPLVIERWIKNESVPVTKI